MSRMGKSRINLNFDVEYHLFRIAIRNRRVLKIMRIFKIDTEKRA
jgi:hypothetical protein